MKITIFGAGYVGLVTGACLANIGHEVLCLDVDQNRIDCLQRGESPIYEPGLDQLLTENIAANRLQFTTDLSAAVAHGACQFIAVGTPPDEDGSADLQYVLQVARNIGRLRDRDCVVVDKSTVPVGTAEKVHATIASELAAREAAGAFSEKDAKSPTIHVVSNPEFLKEGSAIADFSQPDRIVVGADQAEALSVMQAVYQPITDAGAPLLSMAIRSAELCKYAANAMLATRISFMNELSHVAERLAANIDDVREGIGLDQRIGSRFLFPGPGYGGSCFPKDVQALIASAEQVDYQPLIMHAVEAVNRAQKQTLFNKLSHYYQGQLQGKRIALWGLAFKPNTDDMREASSRVLMESLWRAGALVQAFDPVAMEEARRLYGTSEQLQLCQTAEQALEQADALVIVTEWPAFAKADLAMIKAKLKQPVIFDGRNLFALAELARLGFHYESIGRPVVHHAER